MVLEPRYVDTHQGTISSIRYSPDGKHITIGGKDGTIRQWKVEAGGDYTTEVVKLTYSEEPDEMSAQAVSKDGRWIVLVRTEDRRFTVWDATPHERMAGSAEAHE